MIFPGCTSVQTLTKCKMELSENEVFSSILESEFWPSWKVQTFKLGNYNQHILGSYIDQFVFFSKRGKTCWLYCKFLKCLDIRHAKFSTEKDLAAWDGNCNQVILYRCVYFAFGKFDNVVFFPFSIRFVFLYKRYRIKD